MALRGFLHEGVWWSYHFICNTKHLERQLGQEADNVLSQLMGAVIVESRSATRDFVVTLELPGYYDERRNWTPPNVLSVPVRMDHVKDLGRKCWRARTLMFTRSSQCAQNRGGNQSAESHFRAEVKRRRYEPDL